MRAQEQWRLIPGWPNYEISDSGRVVSHKGREPREIGSLVNEYRRVMLSRDGERRSLAVHRLVAETFIGPCPDGADVRHLDGNSLNNVVDNLAYGTRSENIQDSVKHGTHHLAKRTHCKRGHEFTPDSTYMYRGARLCRPCRMARLQERAA